MSNKKSFDYKYNQLSTTRTITGKTGDNWEIHCLKAISGTLFLHSSQTEFQPDSLMLIPSHTNYQFRLDRENASNNRYVYHIRLSISKELLHKYSTILHELTTILDFLNQQNDILYYQANQATPLVELLEQLNEMSDVKCISVLPDFIYRLAYLKKDSSDEYQPNTYKVETILKQVNIYIMYNIDKSFTLDDIAKHVEMSRFNFCHFFKKYTGDSFFSYLIKKRIEFACKMLKETDLFISEICYKAGFNDVPHFNRVFKRTMQMSPKEYKMREKH